MTPVPRSRAGMSVTSRPCRTTMPESGISSPAMIRRIVVFAAARRAEQHDDLVLIDAEVDLLEHRRIAKAFAQVERR